MQVKRLEKFFIDNKERLYWFSPIQFKFKPEDVTGMNIINIFTCVDIK